MAAARLFDEVGAGGFQLVDYTSDIADLDDPAVLCAAAIQHPHPDDGDEVYASK